MKCQDAVHALLEASPPWPPALGHHLEGCEACRSLAALHVSATGLKGPPVGALPAIAREGVLGEVRRRGGRRRAAWVTAASLAVAALAWGSLSSAPPAERAVARVEGVDTGQAPRPELSLAHAGTAEAAAVEAGARAERDALAALVVEVRGYSRRDVVKQDDLYRPFGALVGWVRPPDSRALEAPPFRTALMPITYQESKP